MFLRNNSYLVLAALLLAGTPELARSAASGGDDSLPEGEDRIHGESHEHETLEEVVVTATPLRRDIIEISQSATVLSGAALQRELGNNIGDTLSRVPGMANASFGQNVGRPVIRGLQGARIGVLTNNMASSDASAVSQDHAVPVEPFLADQVEVLRGPATLLYGSGAIGGVVNIVSHVIPNQHPEGGLEARAMLQGDSAADQQFGAGRIDFSAGDFVFHADAFVRRSDDYEIPGEAELYEEHDEEEDHDDEEEHHEAEAGVLENSFLDNEGGSLGAAWINGRWRMGLAWSGYQSDYGIPGAHSHAGEEHDDHDHDDADADDHDEGEELVTIGLESSRVDGELEGTQPFAGVERLKLKLAVSDYEHTEFEGDEVGTVFTNDTFDARLELRHTPWGRSEGAFGVQYTDRDFGAAGEEAFVPNSKTRTGSVFWVESVDFGSWILDLGARYEDVKVDAEASATDAGTGGDDRSRSFTPFTASIGAVWHVNERSHLNFNLSRAERAPTDQELFGAGPHLATQTFEIGDSSLGTETNLHMEIGYRMHQGRLTGSVTFYTDAFSDYIYQRDTGLEEDGLPVRRWSQQDADFWGGELELRYDAGRWSSGHWQGFVFADAVRGEFDDGSDIPRLPPHRFGLGIDWDRGAWAGNVTWIHAAKQDQTAAFETETPGYDLLSADLSWAFWQGERAQWEAYLKGHNLLDEDIRNSTSFLKDQAPQIGRNFVFGIRAAF